MYILTFWSYFPLNSTNILHMTNSVTKSCEASPIRKLERDNIIAKRKKNVFLIYIIFRFVYHTEKESSRFQFLLIIYIVSWNTYTAIKATTLDCIYRLNNMVSRLLYSTKIFISQPFIIIFYLDIIKVINYYGAYFLIMCVS